MTCINEDIESLITAYNALAERCCVPPDTAKELLSPSQCLILIPKQVYQAVQTLLAGGVSGCGTLVEDPLHPAPSMTEACTTGAMLDAELAWIENISCGEGPCVIDPSWPSWDLAEILPSHSGGASHNCVPTFMGSAVVTNTTGKVADLIAGADGVGVDDDLSFNGAIFEEGEYPYGATSCNGVHAWPGCTVFVANVAPGASVTIGIWDNFGNEEGGNFGAGGLVVFRPQ